MTTKTLAELVDSRGQAAVAQALGVSAPAIAKALQAERSISVTEHEDGSLTAEEIRPFPSQNPKHPSAA